MKANAVKLLDFLKKSNQFTVPIYQRAYSWEEQECKQLWNDILRTGKDDNIPSHFIGSIVYIEKGLYQISSQSSLLVIDGQQRLTTVALIIEMLARHIKDEEPLKGFSKEKLRNYYLLNPLEKEDLRYKLLLKEADEESLKALVNQQPLSEKYSIRIKNNFELFKNKIKKLNDSEIQSLCKGLTKLIIVDISLDRNQDKPQLIFESMNSTGLELNQADLIRNFILMDLEPEHQKRLYKNYWRPMELDFGTEVYRNHFDSFIRDYLTVKTKEIPNVKKVYSNFKDYVRDTKQEIEAVVKDIKTFSDYYCAIALDKETNQPLKSAFSDLIKLKVNVSYPFLLEVYHDYKKGSLNVEDFESIVRWVESYVFRRAVCNIPTNSLNKTFATFGRAIKKDRYLESVKAHFLLQSSYRRFPNDNEFFKEIQLRDLYNFRSSRYWLRKLENHNRKEPINLNEYTIEHIMPQNEDLSKEWQNNLGSNWKEIQKKYLHTLGNLTLTGYNSEHRDKPFKEKQEISFKNSPLYLNKSLSDIEIWGENEIKERSRQMAEKAKKVWSAPSLRSEILETYRPKKRQTEKSDYSIESYPYLKGKVRSLFDAFQRDVLALDSCITEEYRKYYIAYKAEKNFVCVQPQLKRLRLSLNLKIHELDDPKKIAKDISYPGGYGTGDVEVGLKSLEELPYIMSLVGQAFEMQMDNERE